MSVRVIHGDCIAVMAAMEPESFSAVVTDPPYHLTSIVKRFATMTAETQGSLADRMRARSDGYARLAASGFMGKTWDGGDVAFRPETWAAVLRVLKPGGYLVAFASTRGYHRMVCAIEDAGFVIHPMLGWLFSSGFPKATSVSKAIDRAAGAEREVVGYDAARARPNRVGCVLGDTPYDRSDNGATITAPATDAAKQWAGWAYGLQSLKPALEPICLAQKPFAEVTSDEVHAITGWDHWCSTRSDGDDRVVTGKALHPGVRSFRARFAKDGRELTREDLGAYAPFVIDSGTGNVLKFGTGALNIDASRVAVNGSRTGRSNHESRSGLTGTGGASTYGAFAVRGSVAVENTEQGRWPANIAHDGSPEVLDAFAKFGERSGQAAAVDGTEPSSKTRNVFGLYNERPAFEPRGDSGSAARFFKSCSSEPEERKGRWPANIAHDGSPEVLDTFAKFGERHSYGPYAPSDSRGRNQSVTYGNDRPQGDVYADSGSAARFFFSAKAAAHEREGNHPTVKPIALMEWLVGLICPRGGRVLDPFCGTGSTLVACDRLDFDAIGIEQDAKTCADAEAKIKRLRARRMIGDGEKREVAPGQLGLDL